MKTNSEHIKMKLKINIEDNNPEISTEIFNSLSVFDKIGILSRKRYATIPSEYRPLPLMFTYRTAIVLGINSVKPERKYPEHIENLSNQKELMSAVFDVMKILIKNGYEVRFIGPNDNLMSIMRLNKIAGIVQFDPKVSIKCKLFKSSIIYGTIITTAPIVRDDIYDNILKNKIAYADIYPKPDGRFLLQRPDLQQTG